MADESTPPDDQPEGEAQPVEAPAGKAPPKLSLPTHKDDLVALAISHGIPSYEAWAMTVAELTEKLGG